MKDAFLVIGRFISHLNYKCVSCYTSSPVPSVMNRKSRENECKCSVLGCCCCYYANYCPALDISRNIVFLQRLSVSNKAYPDKSSRYQSLSKILSKATNFPLIFVVVVAFI